MTGIDENPSLIDYSRIEDGTLLACIIHTTCLYL